MQVRRRAIPPLYEVASFCNMTDGKIAGGGAVFSPMISAMGRSSLSLSAIEKKMRASTVPFEAAPVARSAKVGGAAVPVRGAGQVRIVGGQWRRRLLPVASGPGVPVGLRPTPDRVRETLFNWLGQDLGGWRCVDLCAGTGALGLEAASRGAASVLLVESHAAVARQLRELKALLGAEAVQVRQADALTVLRELARPGGTMDLVLFDPPFDSDWYAEALQAALPAMRAEGTLYLEAGREWLPYELAALGWQRRRYLKAGNVHAHLLQPLPPTA